MSETKTMKYPSGLILHRKYDNTSEVWEIDNQALSTAEFTLNIEGCENCTLDNAQGETTQTVVVAAQKKNTDIKITKTLPWSFAARFSLSETPISLEEQKDALKTFKKDWDNKIEDSEQIFKKIPYEVLPQADITKEMAKSGQGNFIDPHFPPRDTSIYNVVDEQYPFNFVVHWRRPHEFMENPVVFEDDIDPNDIRQGQLGDCWFLSALSSLAERPGMVRRLFITQEYNKEGIYQIKICKNGEWVTVTIDDYIPCRYNGGPMFSRGSGNELWVMLIEKAYAKLHGSYAALSAGFTKHAMVDLSGCPTEFIAFPREKDDYEDIEEEADEIFEKLLEADEEGYLISTETSGVDTITEGDGPGAGSGLVSGHAYSVIQVKEGLGVKLLNIRNPWGQFEWNGAWGDESEEWTEEMIEEFNPKFDANDGSFWMCLEDFIMKFEAINFCKIENYEELRFKGKFLKTKHKDQEHESVISKFYYTFEIEEDDTTMHIGLHQEDERIVGAHLRRNMDAGFVVLKIEGDDGEEESEFYDYCEFTREREYFKKFTFEEGKYAVVPLTSGACIQKTLEASSQAINPKFEFEDTVWPHPYFSSTINDIFRKLDLAVNGLLSADELNQFGKIIEEPVFMDIKQGDFAEKTFEDVSWNKEGVSLLGFKQLLFRNFNDGEIMQILEKLGYDQALNSVKSRAFMISFQVDDVPVTVDIHDILDSDYHKSGWEYLLNHIKDEEGTNDQCTEEDDYTLFAYPHPHAYTSSYMFENTSEDHLEVTLDMSDSENWLFIPSDGTIKRTVPPGETWYLGSLACDPDAKSFSYSYNLSAQEVDAPEEEEYEDDEVEEDDDEEGSDEDNEDEDEDADASSGEDSDY